MAISTRLKSNSRNLYLCGSELGINTVKNDYQIKIGSHQFEIFSGEKIARSTGTTNPHTAEKIAIELTRIVRDENKELWAKKSARQNQKKVTEPVAYDAGDPENIDNWTMEDALIYKAQLNDASFQTAEVCKRIAQKVFFETGNSGLPERFGDWPLMTDDTLAVYKEYRWKGKLNPRGKPYAEGTKSFELGYIRSALILAEHLSRTKGSGLYHRPKISVPVANNRREEFLDYDEANRMFEYIKTKRPALYNLYICLVFLGARPIELARLKWDDVRLDHKNPERSTVKLWHQKGAGKLVRTRRVALHPFVYEALCRELIKRSSRDNFVFRNQHNKPWRILADSGRANTPAFADYFVEIKKELNFNHKLVCYSMRHTFGSWLVQNGETLVTVKDLMGHANINTTMNYLHVNNTTKINAIQNLGKEQK